MAKAAQRPRILSLVGLLMLGLAALPAGRIGRADTAGPPPQFRVPGKAMVPPPAIRPTTPVAKAAVCGRLAMLGAQEQAPQSVPRMLTERDDNWHQWRGPLASGVSPKGDPPVSWDTDHNLRWRVEIPGEGTATPIVWGNQVINHEDV
ncbi:MAG: hypothetical protein ACLQNE_39035 [Thermoguttaceae bacterium]